MMLSAGCPRNSLWAREFLLDEVEHNPPVPSTGSSQRGLQSPDRVAANLACGVPNRETNTNASLARAAQMKYRSKLFSSSHVLAG